jgi:hypothetical protein
MACRSTKRAEVARKKLYCLLDAHIEKQRRQSDYDGHAHEFRRNLNIQIHYIDLAVVSTVFRFAEELLQQSVHLMVSLLISPIHHFLMFPQIPIRFPLDLQCRCCELYWYRLGTLHWPTPDTAINGRHSTSVLYPKSRGD